MDMGYNGGDGVGDLGGSSDSGTDASVEGLDVALDTPTDDLDIGLQTPVDVGVTESTTEGTESALDDALDAGLETSNAKVTADTTQALDTASEADNRDEESDQSGIQASEEPAVADTSTKYATANETAEPEPQEQSEELTPLEQGRVEHQKFQDTILENAEVEEGLDSFTTEQAIRDTDGAVIRVDGRYGRPDFVDYENDIIMDLKPIHEGETIEDVQAKYQDQMDFYANSYKKARGVEPKVLLSYYSV